MYKRSTMVLLLCISIAGFAQAGVVAVENSGGSWTTQEVLAGEYSDACMNLWANQYMAVGADGATAVWKSSGSWHSAAASATSYTAVAWNAQSVDQFIAAKTAGGVDYVPWTSATDTGLTNTYTKLCNNQTNTAPNQYFGITSAGTIDLIYQSSGVWHSQQTVSNTGFTAIASNNCEDQVFTLNSSGLGVIGVNSGWKYSSLYSGNFNALCGDDQLEDRSYFSGPGGLMSSQWVSTQHVISQISSTAYIALAPIGGETEGIFGARASGGIDRIYWDTDNSQWVTENIVSSGYYSVLAGDFSDPNVFLAIPGSIPEPATLALLAAGGICFIRRRK